MLAKTVFTVEFLWILFVAALDNFLLLKYANHIVELNPVGIWLIETGGIPLFSSVKLAGTCVVLAFLLVLYQSNQKMAIVITHGVALIMTCLVFFLFYS